MKHRNPTRQHALLALLASLSLSGCQWDSVLYDSYIAAFGESGAGGYAECPGMEYILIRDTTTKDENNDNTEDGNTENNNDGDDTNKESNYIKLYRSTCCITNEDGSCTLRENALEINKYCIAFQFNKCPLTASRCMTETVITTNSLEDTGESDKTKHKYCAEVVCASHEIECYIEYKELNSSNPDEIKTEFTCIDPSEDNSCNAICPMTPLEITQNMTFREALEDYYSKNGNICPDDAICKFDDTSIESTPSYKCNCPSELILCDNECINPNTNIFYCGAKGACNSSEIGENYHGKGCENHFNCVNGACCENLNNDCQENNVCIPGYNFCKPNGITTRNTPTCLPNNPNEDTKLLWKQLNLDEDGCNCLLNYENQDKNDANGCEVAKLATKCGIIDKNAINCIERFHANSEDTKCIEDSNNDDNRFKCKITSCQPGYYPVKIEDLENTSDENAMTRLADDGKACRFHGNECCGITNEDKCNNCISNGKICGSEASTFTCIENNCNTNEISCLGKCFTASQLDDLNIDTNCTCKDGYNPVFKTENSLLYCEPDPEAQCKLKADNQPHLYCFNQCFIDKEITNANLNASLVSYIPGTGSTNIGNANTDNLCQCINGYAPEYYISSNDTTIDPKSTPGHCKLVIDKTNLCGYEQINCEQDVLNSSSITCTKLENSINYVCGYETCDVSYCDWDNNKTNGCETKLPAGFKDCNSCEDNAILSIQNNNKKCIRKGNGWSNNGWANYYVNEYCDDCKSGEYCCLESHYGFINSKCGSKQNCK